MDITDVAATRGRRTGPIFQAGAEVRIVNVADDFGDEVAAADVARPIYGEHRFTCGTGSSSARVGVEIPMKVGVNLKQSSNFVWLVIAGNSFEGVDPNIYRRTKLAA